MSNREFEFDRSDLRVYQEAACEFAKRVPNCALWIGQRLGKTIATLTAVADLYDDFEITQVLVVAPLRVSLASWPRDFHKWKHVSHLTYSVIRGTPQERARQASTYANVHIINRENLAWLVGFWGERWPYDVVVLDEARSFKNHTRRTAQWGRLSKDEQRELSRRYGKGEATVKLESGKTITNGCYTRFGALAKVRPYIDRVIELTGTPAPGGLSDLWAQIYLLDGGERLGKTITAFRERWFTYNLYARSYEPNKRANREIHERVADITFVLEAGDYVSLPEKIPSYVEVDIPEKAMAAYRRVEEEFVLEFDGGEVDVLNAAAKLGKAMQISNGAAYIGEGKTWQEYHQEKLNALDELIEQANGEPVLVAYTHIPDKERILKKYKQFRFLDKNPKTIDEWNAGRIPGLVCHPASAGHGLDLFGGGNTIIWFGMTHDLELYQQLNERLSHPDKTSPIVIHHLLGKDTVDADVVQALQSKAVTQADLLRRVKEAAQRRVAKNN